MRIASRQPLYVVTDRWVSDCLIGDGSLLVQGRQVWTEQALAGVHARFVDAPDDDVDRSFDVKLADQFRDASDEERLLFAEVRAMQLLPMADVGAASKRSDIEGLLDLLGVDAALPADVGAAFEFGFSNVGMARVNKYWHLCFIINRALAFKRLDPQRRRDTAADAVAWKAFVRGSGIKRVGVQENLWLHAGLPDHFQPIASSSDKSKIVAGLSELSDGSSDVDLALLAIQRALVEQHGSWVWPYDPTIRPLWDPNTEAPVAEHSDEGRWRTSWAEAVVAQFCDAGGQPTFPDGHDIGQEVRGALKAMAESGDVEQFLTWTKSVTDLRRFWSGPYTTAVRAWVANAPEPQVAARQLADALVAPADDDEARLRIAQLNELREAGGGGLWGTVLASAVWHWQDHTVAPWTMASADAIRARWSLPELADSTSGYLDWQERMASFGPDVRWLFPALNGVDGAGTGLRAIPAADVERCAAAAAGEGVDLAPVLVDLQALITGYAARAGIVERDIARSHATGPDVWAELRVAGRCVLRLWLSGERLIVCRPSQDGSAPAGLSAVTIGGAHADAAGAAQWHGRELDTAQATDPVAVAAAVDAVLRVHLTTGDSIQELFHRFRDGFDRGELDQKRLEREELAASLTTDALREPDLDGLRAIVTTGKYGSPGPMPALNASMSQAAERGELHLIGQVFDRLCNGDGPLADRIDTALASDVHGLGESVVMKALAIAHPALVLPVFPYSGEKGKSAMLDALDQPQPAKTLGRGRCQMAANDQLMAIVGDLSDEAWELGAFLYWLLEREPTAQVAADSDDEDRLATVAQQCFVDRRWLVDIVELLEDRGQIVMYGPPGTGKTFIAQRLAEALAPDESRRRLVQFHPAYGYEDFFEGLRPRTSADGVLTYELVDGPLKAFAARAAADPTHQYVMIIDEINRANLPKVFGELLFLLEYRDQSIHTMYGDETFSLPKNLAIIATMNTADRSIALVDAALRRRFHFVALFPDREPVASTLRAWLTANSEEPRVADLVDHANATLREKLGGPHLQIGPSHFMKRGITEKISRIWQYSIEPLIEEQLYGDDVAIEQLRWHAMARTWWTSAAETNGELASEEPAAYAEAPTE